MRYRDAVWDTANIPYPSALPPVLVDLVADWGWGWGGEQPWPLVSFCSPGPQKIEFCSGVVWEVFLWGTWGSVWGTGFVLLLEHEP